MNKRKIIYYENREDEFKYFMCQLFQTSLSFFTLLMSIVTLIIVLVGNKKIEDLHMQTDLFLPERIPVDEMFEKYIDSLPVPEREISIEEETKEIAIPDVKERAAKDISTPTTIDWVATDYEILAQLTYAEEGVFFKYYDEDPNKVERVFKLAGSVVINRAEIGYMGNNTIQSTIFAKGQYDTQTLTRVTEGQNVPEVVYTWMQELLEEGTIGPRGLIYQAEFEQGTSTYEHIGNQYFCIEEKYN